MRALYLPIFALALLTAGCQPAGSPNGQPAEQQSELTIFVGAGIRPPVAELAELFARDHGVHIVSDYAGSEVLLSKIQLAERGDIYMPGDKHYVDQAAEAGLILSQQSVCYFVPTILVQKGNPKQIAGLQDLVKPGIKLGLGDEKSCAIGRTCKRIFEQNGFPWEKVEKNLAFQSMTVNELGMQIQAQSLDAVIVWDAIAAYYADDGDEVVIPLEQNVISRVNVAVLKFTQDQELAEQFVEFVASDQGRAIFQKHGYRTAPPE